ncbi:hypothetical protein EMIHUDRAFT_246759 [Emiliania huxleyi CCMP1516]|uniref:Uncharacterized protein n=2 Tax=Emiliania huxleyi TaxID=2903 RepID=A0A0D3IQW9_EMIH1|nr:hypothetical protein EMIHUDRAFT_246759 [Emiliania huxleyi CCMP1516]EOD13654.1 hypothetical protein EMIHUDRAFT_246759 [Emiliania huxleyi CCMP1516]|eukprot:XP_005766083.1 hypothetical protein EMIHUDRAFT_246759 [Emiliania huxleyi CCMP1516]
MLGFHACGRGRAGGHARLGDALRGCADKCPWLLGAPLVVLRALRGATDGASEWRPPLAWTKGTLGKFLRFAQGHNPWASCWSAANRNAALCDYRIVPQLHRFSSDIIVNSVVRCEDAVSTAPDLF